MVLGDPEIGEAAAEEAEEEEEEELEEEEEDEEEEEEEAPMWAMGPAWCGLVCCGK